jgi:RimJ/RimL family protein N-acetyltransferase
LFTTETDQESFQALTDILQFLHPSPLNIDAEYNIKNNTYLIILNMTSGCGNDSLPGHSKYFLRQWIVTVPSYPSLKFYRATPSHFDVWTPIMTDPKNNELQDTKDKVWDEAAIAAWLAESEASYHESNIKFKALEVLVEFEGRVVGYGGVWPTSSDASIGILLNEGVRGRGIGRTAMCVLIQIGFDFGLPVSTGTMKANVAMRALMKSLGVPEEEKLVTDPVRGVLAEVVYSVQREGWKLLDMKVEFGNEEQSKRGNS